MQELVDHVAGRSLDLEGKLRRDLALLPRESRRFKPLPTGHGAKALASALLAQSVGADVSIFMADSDSNDPARTAEVRAEIQAGFAAASDAGLTVKGVACVAMSTSESWLLADANSWLKVTGFQPDLPRHPELIWGARNDPAGDHPKQYFRRTTEASGVPDSLDTRNQLAAAASVKMIAKICPYSFEPFANDLAAEVEAGR
ncbi:MAG: hypothetical protein K2X61_06685 [Caulobacteraceae bacterium]|nr:hypothetical protein [Caulobacteraceae bacterium]